MKLINFNSVVGWSAFYQKDFDVDSRVVVEFNDVSYHFDDHGRMLPKVGGGDRHVGPIGIVSQFKILELRKNESNS